MSSGVRIGWIGTGVMGLSMCKHLLEAGYSAHVYSRTRSKAAPLVELGAKWCDSPAQVAMNSDIMFTMLGFPSDVRDIILGQQGLVNHAHRGALIIDMTTSEPSLAREIAAAAAAKGIGALDAPVSGGDVGAKNATLSIMVGGRQEDFDRVLPLLEKMGKNIRLLGGSGSGQNTKMVNQILIATNMIGVCEGLLYAHKAGLDLEQTIQAVSAGAAGSWSISNLGPRIAKRNFDPGFFVEHFIKDMGIALSEARAMNLSLPGLALAHQLYVAVKAQGHGKQGTHALALALEQLNGIKK
jgi:3-hydroxyisobutyrate dehydrogenase